jgi:hypothetical protein
VCFDDTSIQASEIHNQCYYPPCPEDVSLVPILDAGGSPEDLARAAADWFELLMNRPIEKHEWHRNGRSWSRYVFADTGQVLSRSLWHDASSPPDRINCAFGPRAGEVLRRRESPP